MLYNYKAINHNFLKIHLFVEHLVVNVWCKPVGSYDINMLHPDFIPIVENVNHNLLKNPIRIIYNRFKRLTPNDLDILQKGFESNNEIEKLCNGASVSLIYSQINTFDPILSSKMSKFFKDLYSKVPSKAAFKKVCGDIDDYYDQFLDQNDAEKCPFCGISDIMTSRLSKRDAFDHYLPKDIYPFNSVNQFNLAPICKTCNSSYKLAKDPINKTKTRRKAFYPFSNETIALTIDAKFKCSSIHNLRKTDVELTIANPKYQEEIDTWMDLFGIEERYKDKFCSKDARSWLLIFADELKNSSKTKHKRFDQKMRLFKNNFIEDNNFLKVPYFIACKQLGLI